MWCVLTSFAHVSDFNSYLDAYKFVQDNNLSMTRIFRRASFVDYAYSDEV
jgi:hypothetical protein